MDDEKTVWCGNLSDRATEELLYELFLQIGPVDTIKIPKDRDGKQVNYAFISFDHEESVAYAQQALNGIRFFNRNLNIKPRTVNTANKESVQQTDNLQDIDEVIPNKLIPETSHSPVTVQVVEEPQPMPISTPEFQESYHNNFKERGRGNYNYQPRNDYSSYRKHDYDNRNRGPPPNRHNYHNNRGNFPARRSKYRPY